MRTTSGLGLAWYADLDTDRGQEATPLVVDGVLYDTSRLEHHHRLRRRDRQDAVDLRPARCRASTGGTACCDIVNRGRRGYGRARSIVGTLDGRLIALDAKTGKPVWSVQTFDTRPKPYTITGAPRVFDGKVIIGNGGGRDTACAATSPPMTPTTGKLAVALLHRARRPGRTGFENKAMADGRQDLDRRMVEARRRRHRWDAIAYDPELEPDLHRHRQRLALERSSIRSPGGGDNLFLCLDRRGATPRPASTSGTTRTTPGEQWDYTATQPMMLADLTIDGEPRKVLMQAPKNGFFYVLDRAHRRS